MSISSSVAVTPNNDMTFTMNSTLLSMMSTTPSIYTNTCDPSPYGVFPDFHTTALGSLKLLIWVKGDNWCVNGVYFTSFVTCPWVISASICKW